MYPVYGSSYGIIMGNRIDFGVSNQSIRVRYRFVTKKEELGWMREE